MNFNASFSRQNLFRKLITLICLGALLLAGWHWLNSRQNNDLSFLLPIYQNGQEIRPAAIISEDGQVLLPVRAIAEQNGWLSQSEELQSGETQASCGAMLLLHEQPAAAETAAALVICWLSSDGQQPDSLGVWLNGQLLTLSAPGRFYQNELYLPEDFFAAAFNLTLKLDEQGRANLLPNMPQA